MNFVTLQNALLAALRDMIRNGDFTERGLAKAAGVSQPHIHNVLKGVRALSPAVSDRLLAAAGLSLEYLIQSATPETGGDISLGKATETVPIPRLDTSIGPDYGWPRLLLKNSPANVPVALARLALEPVIARAGRDPDMEDTLIEGEWILLDQAIIKRREIREDALYLVRRGECGLIRRLKNITNSVYLISDSVADRPAHWERIPLGSAELSHIVRARVLLLGLSKEWGGD